MSKKRKRWPIEHAELLLTFTSDSSDAAEGAMEIGEGENVSGPFSDRVSRQYARVHAAEEQVIDYLWGSPMLAGVDSIGWTLRLARMNAGLSQYELARAMQAQQPAIARAERAAYTGHTLNYLARVAAASHYRVHIVFSRDHAPSPVDLFRQSLWMLQPNTDADSKEATDQLWALRSGHHSTLIAF